MNIAVFSGNLARNPETKVTSKGKNRAMFTLAVNRRYKNPDGTRDADFITLIAYDRNADIAQQYLEKGKHVQVTAHVQTGRYEKDGQMIYTTQFIVDTIEMTQGGRRDEQRAAQQDSEAEAAAQPTAAQPSEPGIDDDDDLPF